MTEIAELARRAGETPPPVLEVSGLEVTFPGGARAVSGVELSIRPGEVLGLVGESGSGKTATALAALGLLPRAARVRGSVRLHGTELLGLPDRELARIRGKDLAMVFQDSQSAFTPVYSIGDQLAEAVRVHGGASRAAARRRAGELLDLVGIPAARACGFPHEFSGGMLQRAMIAMAMAHRPAVLIADEPTTALDVTVQAQILEVLALARRETGAALLLVTHDLGIVAGVADRVSVMYAGRIVESGTVADVFRHPRMPYTIGLLAATPRLDADRLPAPIDGTPPSPSALPQGCPFAPRCPLAVSTCTTSVPPLIPVPRRPPSTSLPPESAPAAGHPPVSVSAGGLVADEHLAACLREIEGEVFARPVAVEQGGAPRAERGVVLAVEGLVRHYPLRRHGRRAGVLHAVDGVGFELREGETLALVGESGCGKTTTLMEILSLRAPQRGRISVLGRDTASLSRRERKELRKDVQIVFQDPLAALDPRMPVADLLAEPLRAHGVSDRHARVRELLELVGLEEAHAARYPQELSGGQRQRVGIARALALEPRLVVLDEPVSALDVSVQAGILRLLAELKHRMDLSFVLVAHDLAVVGNLADRVAVMYLGRIVEIGDVSRIYDAPAHPYTRALLSAVPVPDPEVQRARRRVPLPGDPPSAAALPAGCRFHTRCPTYALLDAERRRRCDVESPEPRPGPGGVLVACHHTDGGVP